MELIQELQKFPYFDELLIVFGALLVLIGAFRILSSSFKLIVWVALAALGVFCVSVGMQRESLALPPDLMQQLRVQVAKGQALSKDALSALCKEMENP